MKHKRFRKSNLSKKIKLKYRRRYKRSRSRSRRLQKGGLRSDTNSGDALGITNTWSFKTEEHQRLFKEYIFGTHQGHMELWPKLLIACRDKEIPVYIITSGNLVGVIRTIQLLGLAEYVEEVISVRKHDALSNPNPEIDPARYFAEQSKPKVIQRIMQDKGFSCSQEEPVAAFFDDQGEHNFKGLDTLCPSVKIVDVQRFYTDSRIQKERVNEVIRSMSNNFFFNKVFNARHPKTKSGAFQYTELFERHNFTSPRILQRAIDGITGNRILEYDRFDQGDLEAFSKIRILFLDWDGTVSFWPGPPDFNGVDYLNIQQYITETPI